MKNKMQKCPECNGSGNVYNISIHTVRHIVRSKVQCHGLLPRGSHVVKRKKCKTCKGRRKISSEKLFEMRLKDV